MVTLLTRSAALALAALALSACSGGSGSAAAPTSTAPTPSATSAPAPSSSAASTASTGATGTQDQVAAKFCADRAELTALGTQIEAGGLPAAIQQLPTFAQRMDSMQPPQAIASDFTEYRAAWTSISEALQGASPEDPTLQAKVQAAIAAHPDAQAVEDRLRTWSDANCPAASASPSAG